MSDMEQRRIEAARMDAEHVVVEPDGDDHQIVSRQPIEATATGELTDELAAVLDAGPAGFAGLVAHVSVTVQGDRNLLSRVYRVRHRRTGNFVAGGHAARGGVFTSKGGARNGYARVRKDGLKLWQDPADVEIVTYGLTELNTEPVEALIEETAEQRRLASLERKVDKLTAQLRRARKAARRDK